MERSAIEEGLLHQLSELISTRMGLYYPRARWSDLERGITAAAPAFGAESAEACARSLLAADLTQSRIQALAHHLTIGETYFFREKGSFETLERHILPPLIELTAARHRPLRVWSAACATGEEAYSIAIVLSRLIPDIDATRVSILGTDIDPHVLEHARRGVYGSWSFRDAPPGLKSAYFRKTADGRYAIDPRIRALVQFDYLNLAEDGYPSADTGTEAVDIVFCRNVLIYFEAARAREVLRKLTAGLAEGGWLFLNPVEIPHARLPHLAPVAFPAVTLHRKDSTASEDAAAATTRFESHSSSAAGLPDAARQPRERTPKSDAQRAPGPRRNAPGRGSIALPKEPSTPRSADPVEKLLGILSRKPDDACAVATLVRTYADRGMLSDARAWCEKALAADRLNATWSYLLATIHAEEGHAGEAATALKRALYLDPQHALAHFALGNLSRRGGNVQEAQRHYRNALSILSAFPQDEVVPESGGMTAGSLVEMIRSTSLDGAGA